jgi:hypothetical protein
VPAAPAAHFGFPAAYRGGALPLDAALYRQEERSQSRRQAMEELLGSWDDLERRSATVSL